MARYRSVQGDTVDLICWRFYNDVTMSQTVLQANQGLADLDFILPIGTEIELPEKTASNIAETTKLWD